MPVMAAAKPSKSNPATSQLPRGVPTARAEAVW
jgi:hypothetical protein